MRRWITRAWNAFCIGVGFKESPKHFEGFVWHRHPEPPMVQPPQPLISARERAQRRCSLRRIELVADDSWLNSGPPVRDTEPTETVPAVKMQALHPKRERV